MNILFISRHHLFFSVFINFMTWGVISLDEDFNLTKTYTNQNDKIKTQFKFKKSNYILKYKYGMKTYSVNQK